MIREHRKLSLADLSNRGNDCSFEVNWNKSKAVKDCQHIRLEIGGKEAIVSRDQLWTLLMLVSDDRQQEEMLPYKQVPVSHYQTMVSVMTQKDVRKGELLTFPVSVSINKQTGQMSIK